MKFKSYPSIENSYKETVINEIRSHNFDLPDIEWVAEVKIDGSNFQCCLDCEDNFLVGKRSSYLERGEDFQGYERAIENTNVKEALYKMKGWISSHYSDLLEPVKNNKFGLRVFGELCGGFYRHADVTKVKEAIKIQGRVSYHPDNVWIPFDIELTDENDEIIFIFSQIGVYTLCTMAGLPHPLIIKKGTFDDVLNVPNDFIDPIGSILFGLPKIENNITEGVVLKPNLPLHFKNGSRVMIKNKNDKFKERVYKEPKAPNKYVPLNDLELKYYEIYREYITESRIMSAISKIGNISSKSFSLILGTTIKDIINDFDKDYGDEVHKLEVELPASEFNLAKARKELSKELQTFIRPIFLRFINEEN